MAFGSVQVSIICYADLQTLSHLFHGFVLSSMIVMFLEMILLEILVSTKDFSLLNF